MIDLGVSKVLIDVVDQDRAKRFWTVSMGCELVQDEPYGDDRWLEVALPDGTVLVLQRASAPSADVPESLPNTPVFLACSDLDDAYRTLTARGVVLTQEPVDMPFGRWSLFEDTEGNRFALTERRPPSASRS